MMGLRGPVPDPSKRLRAGRPDLAPVVQLGERLAAPRRPKNLHPVVRRWWDAYWGSDVARAVKESDLPAISRLFAYYDGRERADTNPDVLLKWERLILPLEKELGLTPSARARLGIQTGQAKLTLASIRERISG